MRSLARWLGVWWSLLAVAVFAAPELPRDVEITVHAVPSAQVYLETPTGLTLLATSGRPTMVTPPVLRDAQGRPSQYAPATVVLRAERHGDLRVPISPTEWAAGRWPARGSFRLPPESFLVGLQDWVEVYPGAALGGLALLLGGLGLAFRWRGVARRKSQEAAAWQQRVETSGDPLVGRRIGSYEVQARLGQGGMGSVYQVSDGAGLYAAKVIYFDRLDGPSVERFRREFRLLSQLRHASFPRCYDYRELEGMAFVVMELVEGPTLRQAVRPEGLPWSTVRPWVLSILEGLECAHQQGIVHRDLKPENIILSPAGPKILDFGIARQLQVTAITMTGQAFGTPQYLAPEQVSGQPADIDPRTDLYSLGVILFELLVGHPPFQAEDPQELVRRHLSEPAPRLPATAQGPGELATVVDTLLAKNPANRYPNARRLHEVLSALRLGEAPSPTGTEAVVPAPQAELDGEDQQATEAIPRAPRG